MGICNDLKILQPRKIMDHFDLSRIWKLNSSQNVCENNCRDLNLDFIHCHSLDCPINKTMILDQLAEAEARLVSCDGVELDSTMKFSCLDKGIFRFFY